MHFEVCIAVFSHSSYMNSVEIRILKLANHLNKSFTVNNQLTKSWHSTATQTRSSVNGTMCMNFQSKRINKLPAMIVQ